MNLSMDTQKQNYLQNDQFTVELKANVNSRRLKRPN